MTSGPAEHRRRLGPVALGGFLLLWLFVPQTIALFAFTGDVVSEGIATTRGTLASIVGTGLLAIAVASIVIQRLGWWRLVRVEPRAVRPWVAVVPISLLGYCALVTDWQHLASTSVPLVLAFGLAMVVIGVSEELVFRGLVLQSLRDRLREGYAVLLSCVVFGLLHLVNAVTVGSGAIGQAVLAIPTGYLLYLCRRVGGGLWLPVLVHASIDFAQLSSDVGFEEQQPSDALFYEFLLMLVLGGLLLVGRRRMAPAAPS